jgi:iron complex outermembrane receptor protein
MRRTAAHALAAVAVISQTALGSEETLLEEIVVTASFVGINESSATRPIHVLDGAAVAEAGIQSLGEHVDALLGVSSADFGGAVGQPIIRGMSGNRVKVLNNGTVIRDVSALGPDHAVDVSLSDVKQIEIVRGPSALMYSNGSIGGIVNVVDNSIPTTDLEGFSGTVGAEAQSVNDGEAVDFTLRGNVGGLNLTYSYQDVDMEDYEIPKGAVLDMHEGHHDEDHDGDHEDGHEEGHEEGHDDMDKLANSDVSTTSHRLGLSTTGDWGYVGLSYSDLSSTYGIPFHSEAAHEEHGDEHEGEHEEGHEGDHEEGEEHHEEDDHAGHDEHGEERIFSKTESEIIALSGSFKTSIPFLNAIDFAVKNTDYELMEQHAEGEEEEGHEGHDDEEGPTVFSNEATEISVAFDLSAGERIRRVVLNYAEEEISIIGEEAFMAPVDSTETTLGFFSSDDLGFATLDLGLRFDQVDRDGFAAEMHHDDDHGEEHEGDHDQDLEGEHDEHHEDEMVYEPASFSDEVFSAAATLRRDLNEHSSLSLSLASVSKTPSAVELFMNGEHLASSRYEVGDITLDTERSDNIDLAFNFDYHNFFGSASIYYNRVDNYIHLRDELEEEHEAHMEAEHEGEHHDEEHDDEHFDHGGLILSEYSQQDAEFTGYEIEIGTRFELPRGELELTFGRDEVDAEFTNGGDVPRIVPARNMFTARYTLSDFSATLLVKDVERQTNVAPGESATDGFTLMNADASWSYGFNDATRLTLTAFARNLTDEVARNHSSFVKDQVPLPGRNIGVRVRLDFGAEM